MSGAVRTPGTVNTATYAPAAEPVAVAEQTRAQNAEATLTTAVAAAQSTANAAVGLAFVLGA